MTKSQEQRMNELAEKHYKNTGHVPTEWAVLNFQAGYTAAMKEADVLVEALEDCGCDCEVSLPVNDVIRDVICHRCYALKKLGIE